MKKIFYLFCMFAFTSVVSASQIVSIGGTSSDSNGVVVSKTIETGDKENFFDITLIVKTPVNINEVSKDKDISVIFVMDISNTMITTNIDGTKHDIYPNKVTRYDAALEASKTFMDEFTSYSLNTDAIRDIGYVVFNSDALKVFDLSSCKDNRTKSNLINMVNTTTDNIVNDVNYNNSKKRFTNMEAGLKLAYDMLKKSNSENKYIIFLSDGFPTTYIKNNYIGYDTYTPYSTDSSEGNFYNSIFKLPCSIGVSYSDRAALKAQQMALKIKEDNITIYSVGAGLDGQKDINELLKNNTKSYSVVDTNSSNYIIGNTVSSFKNWLKNNIGSGYYYDTNSISNIKESYKDIFNKIKKVNKVIIEPGIVEDIIPQYIEFLSFYKSSNIVGLSNNKIIWNLKKSSSEVDNNLYIYKLKYRVRLQNELAGFLESSVYDTNGKTSFTYKINNNEILSDNYNIDFKIPKVRGYLADIVFTKVSSFNNKPLEGVKFKLVHNDCDVDIADFYSTSDSKGNVRFESIPSGHTYILQEVKTLDNYLLDNTKYNININYGNIDINPTIKGNIIKNDPIEYVEVSSPNTVDNIYLWILIFFVSLLGILRVIKIKWCIK